MERPIDPTHFKDTKKKNGRERIQPLL